MARDVKPAEPAKPDEKPDKPAEKKKVPLELKPGGYLHSDQRRLLNDPGTHELAVRRLRFKLDATAGKHFKFRTLIDFAGSKLVVDDAWAELVIAPEFSLRAGKDKSQFGIERLVSAANLSFIERAFPTQFSPNRDIGVWARGDIEGGLVHYAAGIVDGVADNAVAEGETDDVLEFNIHLLISPFAKKKELGDLGIGGATTFGRTKGSLLSTGLTNIKSANLATVVKFASGTDLAATAVADGYRTRFAGHAYYYNGPTGVMAEYVRDREPILLDGGHTLIQNSAWQLATEVAVTPGDKPSYKSIKPKQVFDLAQGTFGAISLVGRYSEFRIDSEAFDVGILAPKNSAKRAREFVIGANWYFNEYLKLQLDYSLTTFESHDATPALPTEHVIATRFQAAI